MNILSKALALKEELVSLRRELHHHPETGMDLPQTTQAVLSALKSLGLEPKVLPHGGITALIGDPQKGKTVLLRADMDALPMREESGLPFASQTDAAHTCGHDMHTACLVGAAALLKEETLPGCVKLMFQPAEEIMQGARSMIGDGILENPKVDAAVMLHMVPMVKTGVIAYGIGTVASSSNVFSIEITGKGGHGASPADCVDPVNVGVHIHLALQELISREVSAINDPAILTIGVFQAGTAENIIPETALLRGTLRARSKACRDRLTARIQEVAEGVANTYRAKAQVVFETSAPPLVADKDTVFAVEKSLQAVLGEMAVCTQESMSGSEDFAEIADRVPSACLLLGGGAPEDGYLYAGHHPQVRFDENALPVGAAAYAIAARAILEQ